MADLVDLVWSAMKDRELYSPDDLADSVGQPVDVVVRVLEFLARYGFAERVTKRELIFRKLADAPNPGETLRILQLLLEEARVRDVSRVATVPRLHKRLYLF